MRRTSSWAACVALLSLTWGASAGVDLGRTRVIYPEGARSVDLVVSNEKNVSPALIKAWVDAGDPRAKPESINVPFSITPPLTTIEAGQSQLLRIRVTDAEKLSAQLQAQLPPDRESMFWLNVHETPGVRAGAEDQAQGRLVILTHNRIKLFYRPKGLKGEAGQAWSQLDWSVLSNENGKQVLRVVNPTPYHVNLTSILPQASDSVAPTAAEGHAIKVSKPDEGTPTKSAKARVPVQPGTQNAGQVLVALPLSTTELELALPLPAGARLSVRVMNDYGGNSELEVNAKRSSR